MSNSYSAVLNDIYTDASPVLPRDDHLFSIFHLFVLISNPDRKRSFPPINFDVSGQGKASAVEVFKTDKEIFDVHLLHAVTAETAQQFRAISSVQ